MGDETHLRRELRKLHLRWWHATRSDLANILQAAGVPQSALDLIPDMIGTCLECRAWQKTALDITPTLELATRRNHKVEADILYYREYLIWH